jgi:tetratricopeptide (TPR) repeat protein
MLHLGTLISNDPMFYVIQGNNYSDMELYAEAEEAYKKAFYILPNRIYPLYRLMLLYEKEDDKKKMTEMALRVKLFKVKVTSPATKEIKDTAINILNKYI